MSHTLFCIGGISLDGIRYMEVGALTATESLRDVLLNLDVLSRLAPSVRWTLFGYAAGGSGPELCRLIAHEGRWTLELPEPQRHALHELAEPAEQVVHPPAEATPGSAADAPFESGVFRDGIV